GELQKLLDDLGDLPFKLRAGRPAFSATSRLCPWKRYCERRAELTAPDFSSRPFRNFLDDPNEAGHFVPRKLPAREVTEIARPDLGVVAQHDGGSDVLAESRVANREYRRLGDLRVAQQDLLDLRRSDFLSSPINDVFDPPNDEKVTLTVQISKIAGSEPAVA